MTSISVIIPVYNTSKELYKCLESIINQTLKDIEIICVDDGSTDNSLEILNKYAQSDSRILVIHQENINAGAARNNGMQYAKGEYLIFLDSDDVYYPTMLEKLYNKAKETNVDFVMTKYDVLNLKSNKLETNKGYKYIDKEVFNKNDINKIFEFSTFVPWNKLYKKNFIDKYNFKFTETKISNDISFVIRTFFLAEKIAKLEENLLLHNYCNSSSLTNKRGMFIDELPQSSEEIYQFLIKNDFFDRYKEEFINFLFNNTIYNFSFISDSIVRERLKKNLCNSRFWDLISDKFRQSQNFYLKKRKNYLFINILTLFLIPSLKNKYFYYKNLSENISAVI